VIDDYLKDHENAKQKSLEDNIYEVELDRIEEEFNDSIRPLTIRN